MSDGCKIELDGLEEVMRNLKAFTPKLKAALALDAQNIAAEMERWAKDNADWVDDTGHARLFLKSTVKWNKSDELMIAMSHHVSYGVYLELCNEGRYAILEKAIYEFVPKFKEGWKEIINKAGVI